MRNRICLLSCRKAVKLPKYRISSRVSAYKSRFQFLSLSVCKKYCQNEQKQSRKNFLVSILSTTRNGFSLLSSCQREFVFLCFQSCRNAISARKRTNLLYSNVGFVIFSRLSDIVRKAKSQILSLENLRGIVRQAKVRKSANSVVTDSSSRVTKRTVRQRFYPKLQNCLFFLL